MSDHKPSFPILLGFAISLVLTALAAICGLSGAMVATGAEKVKVVQAYVFTMDGCPPCKRMHDKIPGYLEPRGFVIGEMADKSEASLKRVRGCHIVFDNVRGLSQGIRSYPTTIIYVDGVPKWRHTGEVSPARLEAEYRNALK